MALLPLSSLLPIQTPCTPATEHQRDHVPSSTKGSRSS
jgi:hypothetical protein